jgi:hypothetical protein
MTSKRESLETSITFCLSALSIVGFVFDADQYFGGSISRDRKEPLQVYLVFPCPMMLDARKNLEEISHGQHC